MLPTPCRLNIATIFKGISRGMGKSLELQPPMSTKSRPTLYMIGPLRDGALECRRGGDLLRFDPRTAEFGVLAREAYIRTFMIVRPLPSAGQAQLWSIFSRNVGEALNTLYLCPVCGYDRLEDQPENFAICPSCGTEFGYDDAFASHAELRAKWLRSGALWWSTVDAHPENWDPQQQVAALNRCSTVP